MYRVKRSCKVYSEHNLQIELGDRFSFSATRIAYSVSPTLNSRCLNFTRAQVPCFSCWRAVAKVVVTVVPSCAEEEEGGFTGSELAKHSLVVGDVRELGVDNNFVHFDGLAGAECSMPCRQRSRVKLSCFPPLGRKVVSLHVLLLDFVGFAVRRLNTSAWKSVRHENSARAPGWVY